MTDESGQTYPFTIDTLLDRAIGPEGYFGAYTVNAHTDTAASPVANAVLSSALARGVPIVSSRQMLTWLDARNNSSFGSLTWNGSSLNFTIAQDAAAVGLSAMLPNHTAAGAITAITRNGSPVAFAVQTIKGIQYATFPGIAGAYAATYAADTTSPTVTTTSPVNGATGVGVTAKVMANRVWHYHFGKGIVATPSDFGKQGQAASNPLTSVIRYFPELFPAPRPLAAKLG